MISHGRNEEKKEAIIVYDTSRESKLGNFTYSFWRKASFFIAPVT